MLKKRSDEINLKDEDSYHKLANCMKICKRNKFEPSSPDIHLSI